MDVVRKHANSLIRQDS